MTDDDSPAFTISHDGNQLPAPQNDGQPVLDLHPRSSPAPLSRPTPPPVSRVEQPAPQVVSNYYYGAQNAPRGATEVGRETITIAPHPTTNRFPWAPVDNPSIPVFRSDQVIAPPVQPPAPVPVAVQPLPQPVSPPPAVIAPVIPEPVPEPVPAPPIVEPPISVPLPALQPEPLPPPAPAPKPIPRPTPKPAPQPEPVVEPVPAPPEPIAAAAEPLPAAAPVPTVTAPVVKSYDGPHGARIYGESNREVWKVLRPGTTITAVVVAVILMTALMLLLLWLQAGRPQSLTEIPIVKSLVRSSM